MSRWVWLSVCLAASPRRKDRVARRAIGTAALYVNAPILMLLYSEGVIVLIWWGMHTSFLINAPPWVALGAGASLNVLIAGFVWIAAIRSDKTGHLFENKALPVIGVILAGGLGAYLVMMAMYFLAFVLWWVWEAIVY